MSPIRLDCIKPFTSNTEQPCILSAPATHVRLQTVQGADGFVVHKCIDIRTLEFFLFPQTICDYKKQNSLLPENNNLVQETIESKNTIQQLAHDPCSEVPVNGTLQQFPKNEFSHTSSSPIQSRRSTSPSASSSSRSAHTSPPSSSSCSEDSTFPTCSGGGGSTAADPGCSSSSSSSSSDNRAGVRKRRIESPGTPCNVDSVAWFVGAGLTGATIRLRRRSRHAAPPLPAGQPCPTDPDGGPPMRLAAPPPSPLRLP